MIMRFLKLVLASVLCGMPAAAAAQVDPCISGSLTCNADLATYVAGILPALGTAFVGVLFAALVFYGFKLAVESRSDSGMQNATQAYLNAFIGSVVVLGAYIFASSFGTVNVIAPAATETGIIIPIITFVVQLVGAVLILNIVIQGFRLIAAMSEGDTDSARKNLLQSLIGAAIVMLTVPIINLIQPGAFSSGINAEIVGIANFLATLFGLLAVLTVIVAGIMLVVSVNESLKDRAKTLIITALIAIVVVMSSLGIVRILLPS